MLPSLLRSFYDHLKFLTVVATESSGNVASSNCQVVYTLCLYISEPPTPWLFTINNNN